MKIITSILVLLFLTTAAMAQDETDKKIRFEFKEASISAVVEYLTEATPWVFVKDSSVKSSTKITAASKTEVPFSELMAVVDSVLQPHKLATVKVGKVVTIMSEEKAKEKTLVVQVGSDPDKIEMTDRVITQIMPLSNIMVADIQKELSSVIKKTVGKDDVAINKHANVLVVSGRSQDIHRLAKILSVLDTQVNDKLKVRIVALKNADAVELAKTLNEIFKQESGQKQEGPGGMGRMMRFFGGGGGDKKKDVNPESPIGQMIRIIPDERTNTLLVMANEENMKLLETLIEDLDQRRSAAMKMKTYPLQHADAADIVAVIKELFPNEEDNQGARRGPWWMGGGQQTPQGPKGREVRAVAEGRTNSVLVTAHESDIEVIDGMIHELDRQITDEVTVKIYTLKNADAEDMVKILQEVFRAQIETNRQTSRNQNNQGNRGGGFWGRMMGASGGNQNASSQLRPSDEIEITADTRTNAVVAKASETYHGIIKGVIKDLDANSTEEMTTYTIPLKNATAEEMATILRDLLNSGGRPTSQPDNGLPFSGQQGNRTQANTRSRQNGNSTRGGGGVGGTRRMGPLGDQEEPEMPQVEQVPQESRRSVEGQVDVQADPSTNSLVIRTSPRNFVALQKIVGDLDRVRPQALIKVLIAEVTLTDDLQFGVEGFWENKSTMRGNDLATNRGENDFSVGDQGFSYMLTGDEFEATLNMFAKDGRLEVLATPRILVLDNQTASINVGKEVPIVVNSQVTQQGNTINTVQYESVGILLEVTPHINDDGLVTMAIHPEISDVASLAESVEITDGVTNPTFIVNSAETTVAVRNGSTVVIGGLIRESSDETVEKVPVLGDIPILGLLFSNTKEKKVKRELMIFLTPYVVFTASELEELSELERSKLKLIDERAIKAEGDRWLDRIRDHVK